MRVEYVNLVVKCVAVLAAAAPLCAAPDSFRIHIDVSKAPDKLALAEKAKAICEEWYPRITETLFGFGRPLPFSEIGIVFTDDVKVAMATRTFAPKQPPHCDIRIPLGQNDSGGGFGGLIIHELTHVVQNTPPKLPGSANWLEEGLSEYVRDKYYTKDITGTLPVKGMVGKLVGYTTLPDKHIDVEKQGYRLGYGAAANFLFWLEQTKDPEIVPQLCAAMSANKYSPRVFKRRCGASLDELWQQFMAWSRR